jgi:hypothetical protein
MRPGDWLIIGVETLDEVVSPKAKKIIEAKYRDNDELTQFFHTPLMAGWNARRTAHAKHAHDIDYALDKERRIVNLLSSADKDSEEYVKVPKSHSLVVKVKLNNETRTILKSTRYHEAGLADYAKREHLMLIRSIPSPDNAAYKLLVFERIKPQRVTVGTDWKGLGKKGQNWNAVLRFGLCSG